MKPSRTKTETADLILTAAERVVLRDGVARLTLEAVAREAKLSKGGLLYHFATKEALIQAMLDRLIQHCEHEIEAHQQGDIEVLGLEPAERVIDLVKRTQLLDSPNPGLRGGIAGADPFWGRYNRTSILSWATKFFIDALITKAETRRSGA